MAYNNSGNVFDGIAGRGLIMNMYSKAYALNPAYGFEVQDSVKSRWYLHDLTTNGGPVPYQSVETLSYTDNIVRREYLMSDWRYTTTVPNRELADTVYSLSLPAGTINSADQVAEVHAARIQSMIEKAADCLNILIVSAVAGQPLSWEATRNATRDGIYTQINAVGSTALKLTGGNAAAVGGFTSSNVATEFQKILNTAESTSATAYLSNGEMNKGTLYCSDSVYNAFSSYLHFENKFFTSLKEFESNDGQKRQYIEYRGFKVMRLGAIPAGRAFFTRDKNIVIARDVDADFSRVSTLNLYETSSRLTDVTQFDMQFRYGVGIKRLSEIVNYIPA